jgi:ring-1,2-phenylacetyl-CoA epoxidase subunit PaaC
MAYENAANILEREEAASALRELLLQLADDELTIGHRDSEWLGLCPDIEGDVAFSSVAQDEVGHAVFYFDLLHQLGEKNPDELAFARVWEVRSNAVLLERGNGDWAYSVVRHFFYDVFDDLRLEALAESAYLPLREGVSKIRREEYYHLLHMKTWFLRLVKGSSEAKEKVEAAVRKIWADLGDLFSFGKAEEVLLKEGILSFGSSELRRRWEDRMRTVFAEAGLEWPGEVPAPTLNGRLGEHTDELRSLIDTMTEVYRLDPAARW